VSKALGKRIRQAREKKGLTQAELAEKIGVTSTSVSSWETGGGIADDNRKNLEKILGSLSPPKPGKGRSVSDTEVSSFGIWLRDQRTKKSLSVIELSKKSGVSNPTIYWIENGNIQNPQASTRNKLAAVLEQPVPEQVIKDTEQEQEIAGLGSLTDFDPYSKKEWPQCSGVYVLYDVSQRPIYIGKGDNISNRLNYHYDRFWFRSPIVEYGSYIDVKDGQLRHQLEQAMIKFLKSNAVINKQSVENFEG
jgi:transcriptional regulator with XRE-family HTH domain